MADDKHDSIEQAIVHLRMAIQHLEEAKAKEDSPVLRLIKKVSRQVDTLR